MPDTVFPVVPRDKFIGWTPQLREKNLPLVVDNPRFLILPWIKIPNLGSHSRTRRYRSTVYILPPSISKKIEGYRWQSFTPPAAGKSRRFRGLICHRRSHLRRSCFSIFVRSVRSDARKRRAEKALAGSNHGHGVDP